ncbi:hypothetical protein llap_17220 [Limosa lapponica baueri]|uniref:MGAT4 conserved region domain-containing protein n=1 Tax=Limosa lapponica baueri TaxID=1758121 RepID=A0A2I0TF98_LIMLA|nr:hypothetical protein llap_17220 [Limosa lapponica baueri]
MMYAQSKGIYYVQLEDDIVAKPNYLSTMKNFALQQPSEEWMILEFSQLGFIGKMFKSLDLSLIVEFILMFYKDKPIDWLLDHILWVKVCNPEKDAIYLGFFFRSGNIEHPEDKLFNTTVEVLPFDSLQSDKEALQEGRGTAVKYRRMPDGYIQIVLVLTLEKNEKPTGTQWCVVKH